VEPDYDQTKALRALVRAREDLVGARVALCNQLRAELHLCWPGPIGLFCDLDSPISLAFLARYPSPADARGLGEERLAAFLKAHRYGGRKTAAQLLARLRSAAAGRTGELETRARRSVVVRLVATLQSLVTHTAELESQIAVALDAHPDGEIFRSFFRSRESVLCAASLLSEIGDCRARYPHRDAIAADGGHARVAKESGKRKQATFRWACNKRLRNALATLAQSTRIWNPWAADRYAAARARGHNHRRALRTLGRAWARIIWRCWQTRTSYDPKSHTGLQQHVTVAIPDPSGPRPDLTATQRMADATVTHWAARRAERATLQASRQPLFPLELDTGRLSCQRRQLREHASFVAAYPGGRDAQAPRGSALHK
jgi:transposase